MNNMSPLDDLIKDAQEQQEHFRKNPGSGIEQSYWTTRLVTLKEARAVYEDHMKEFDKCKEDPQYFMKKYAHVKVDRLQKPEPGSVNVEKVVKKRTPEQQALRKMIMDPNMFVYDKKSKARLMKNLKGKKGDEE